MQPLGNAVDKKIGDLKLRQVTTNEALVFRPQALGNLAHRGAAQQAAAIPVGKHRLDVPRRQPTRIHLHRQPLQLLGPAPHDLANARAERLAPVSDLRRAVLNSALGALHPTGAIPVAISGAGGGASSVVVAPQRVPRFTFQTFSMISRAASRTSSERPSATSLRPSISALSFSRVRSDAGILSIGVLLRGGRSPNRT